MIPTGILTIRKENPRMIKLRRLLNPYLKTLHPRAYNDVASSSKEYPYIVYKIGDNPINDGEGFEQFIVDIDGWDVPTAKGDTTRLELLMEKVNGNYQEPGLDKKTLTADDMVVVFYLSHKAPIRDSDGRIKNLRYTYEARVFNI